MNKVVRDMQDNSKKAAETGAQVLAQLEVLTKEVMELKELVCSLMPDGLSVKHEKKGLFGKKPKQEETAPVLPSLPDPTEEPSVPAEEQIKPEGKVRYIPGKGYVPVKE